MKLCPKCQIVKSFDSFHKSKIRADGYQSYCKVCRKEIDAKSYSKSEDRRSSIKLRRDVSKAYNSKLLKRYKEFCGCSLCDEKESVALDLHHLDSSSKDMNPSSAVHYSLQRLREEIRKCIVLCANCHRKVHAGIISV